MVSDINSNISSFANKESIKLEMLDVVVSIYKDEGIPLNNEAKDFVLNRTEELLDKYDVGGQVTTKSFLLEDGTWSDPYVHINVIDSLFDDFRHKLAMIFLQLISYDLSRFIIENEEK